MIRTRYLILFMVFLALLLTTIVHAESINDLAYQNRFLLKAGTILNDEQNGEWTGIGDCLIFPYYDARQVDGKKQTTVIKIKNISEYGIVAKLRVRESSLGAEVFSKDIWIPSSSLSDDVGWQGTIEINAAGNNAVISSFDSIVSRNDTNSFYLSNSLSSGIPFSTRNMQKKNSGSILYGSIEVIGEEKTSPQNINGKVGRLASTEQDCPNTLLGKGIVNRPDEGVSMTYDAVAIGNFSRGQGSLFRSIGSLYPRLDTCEDTLDQLEFQLSKSEIYAPYALDPSNQGKTSLIIAYPTKFFHYQNGSRINQVNNPFEGQTQTQGEQIDVALSGQGQAFVDSSITLPYSVNVIGLYKDYNGKPFGIDNVTMPAFSSEFGEATLTSGNLSQRVLIADYEYYNEGRFMMYKGLPAVGLVLQESQDSGQVNATLTAVEYSTNWIASNVEVISTPATPSGPVFGLIGTSYAFTASGSSSSLGHPIEYQFDWTGDGSTDLSSWGADTQFNAWAAGGVFTVKVRARCAIDTNLVSKWSNGLIVTIETVSAPTLLSGPTVGIPNQSYSYTASGAFSNAGHSLQYQFDWGDGATSPWGSGTQSKAWTAGGSYQVKARARCATHTTVVSDWTSGLTVVIEMVSTPSTPVGPSFGDLGVSYSFSTGGSVSNTGHSVEYQFDWGDGTFSSWGSSTQSKSWNRLGTFIIKAKARCVTDHVESDWSSGLTFVIETISTPSPPTGPTNGIKGIPYSYSASGAISSSNDTLEYQFDWNGDGATDLSPWGGASQTKAWTNSGTYTVRVRARSSTHPTIVTGWSQGLVVVIEFVSSPTTLTGPTIGTVGEIYPYIVGGASSDSGDPVQYRFDWGDGTTSVWLSVGTVSVGKTWTNPGTYTVKAQARCSIHTNVTSSWSAGLAVTISAPPPQPESISTSQTPVGPNLGDRGVVYSFSTGGSISTLGHSVEYQFDWGDGTFSPWGSATQAKSWDSLGSFVIKAHARCVIDPSVVSDWSSGLTFVIETISTPSPPSGPTNGIKGIPYSYSTSGAISSSNDTLEYQFDWNGDGATDLSPWGGASQTKAWTNSGTYTVRVRARSSTHPTIVTGWSQGLVVVIEFVNPPMAPTGPTSGSIAEIYSYLTGGASSDLGDPIEYQFDWGDGTTSGWLPTGTMSMGKAWTDPGIYTVKAQARCSIHTDVVSNWSPGIGVTISTSPPPGETVLIPSPPTGPTYGTKGVSYTYTTSGTISTFGDPVEYQFDWGNGIFSSWGGVSQSNIWSTSGLYTVRVRARCQIHPTLVTDWSAGLQVGIEFVSTPATPIGSTSGTVGDGYSYSTGGSSSDLGPTHQIQYQFDWGDGSTSEWLPVGTTSVGKAWVTPGTYIVMAHARCAIHGIVSSWSQELLVTMNPGPPPQAETISTPFIETVAGRGSISVVTGNLITGVKNIPYTFAYSSGVSNLGHAVEHQFDWGDGIFSLWGDSTNAWSTSGDYLVKIIARDVDNPTVMSDWSSGLNVVIDYITAPNTPVWVNGPSNGIGYVTPPAPGYYTFSTGGSFSEIGQPLQYRFNWGDGTDSGWLPVGTLSANHVWTVQGTYSIRVDARGWWYLGADGSTQHFSDYSQGLTVTIRPTEVVSPPSVVSGPIIGIPNTVYPYTTGGAVSSLGHPVQYFFDWGDGTDSNWLPVGTTSATKSWPNGGTYNVRVKAMCATDTSVVSAWSTVLVVKIELISTPTTPIGPSQGIPGNTFTYMTGGASSNINTPIEYQIDWAGDGSDLSSWQTSTSFTKTWVQGGNFQVKARARDASNISIMSNWSSGLTVKIELITVSTPTGPTTVVVNTSGTYSATGSSNIGDPVQIRFIFSDGGDSGFLPVGTTSYPKTWTSVGPFTVIAQARCAIHTSNASALSAPLAVAVNNPVPTVSGITPSTGGVGTTVNITNLSGTGFVSGTTVKLTKSGSSDISGTSVVVVSSTQITCTFTLTGAATGLWNVVVTNATPGGGTATLANGFTVSP